MGSVSSSVVSTSRGVAMWVMRSVSAAAVLYGAYLVIKKVLFGIGSGQLDMIYGCLGGNGRGALAVPRAEHDRGWYGAGVRVEAAGGVGVRGAVAGVPGVPVRGDGAAPGAVPGVWVGEGAWMTAPSSMLERPIAHRGLPIVDDIADVVMTAAFRADTNRGARGKVVAASGAESKAGSSGPRTDVPLKKAHRGDPAERQYEPESVL